MLPVAILAGGLATRLHPLTINLPKALIPFNGKPFIEHQLNLLRNNDIDHVVICAGYRGMMIQDVIGTGEAFGLHVEYSFDEPDLLGTGGALKKALPLLGSTFFVLYGDAYVLCDFNMVEHAFLELKKPTMMTVAKSIHTRHKPNVHFENGVIHDYTKQYQSPYMHHFDYGLHVMSSCILDAQHTSSINKVTDYFGLDTIDRQALYNGQLAGLEITQPVYEIGSFKGIDEFSAYVNLHHILSG